MAEWSKNKVDPSNLNKGQEYTKNDNVSLEELNSIVNNSLYASDVAYTANTNSENAITTANSALLQVIEKQGTVVTVGGEAQATFDADTKADLNFVNAQLNTVYTNITNNYNDISTNASNIDILQTSKANADASNISVTKYQNQLNNLGTPSLTDSASHVNAGQAVVVESYLSSDKLTWYRVWSDGWKECGGRVNETKVNTAYEIALPVVFSNLQYLVNVTCEVDSYQIKPLFLYTRTTTNKIRPGTTGTCNYCNWYCCGY